MLDTDQIPESSVVHSVVMRVELPPEELHRIYRVVHGATHAGVVSGALTAVAILLAVGAAVYFTLPKR